MSKLHMVAWTRKLWYCPLHNQKCTAIQTANHTPLLLNVNTIFPCSLTIYYCNERFYNHVVNMNISCTSNKTQLNSTLSLSLSLTLSLSLSSSNPPLRLGPQMIECLRVAWDWMKINLKFQIFKLKWYSNFLARSITPAQGDKKKCCTVMQEILKSGC